ncbi:alpha/beta fold hydrolase [Streptomyces sp. YKOK-I1]
MPAYCLEQNEEVFGFLGWERYAVEGQSLGGRVAALHALDRPEQVAALVLATPMGLWPDDGDVPAEIRHQERCAPRRTAIRP